MTPSRLPDCDAFAQQPRGSRDDQRHSDASRWRKPGHQLDEIDLTPGTGLREQTAKMCLGGARGHAQRAGNIRHAAELDEGEQHPEFSGSEPVELCDDLGRGGHIQRELAHGYSSDGRVSRPRLAPRARREWQKMSNMAMPGARRKRDSK